MKLLENEKYKMFTARYKELMAESSALRAELAQYEIPGSEGEYSNKELLQAYKDTNKKVSAIFKEMLALSGEQSNAIINEEETT
jgi:predicted ribosome quality control (RQC) complex YloA/Tae2 family protein